MNVAQKVGVVLRRYRYKNNMSQVDLAAAADSARSFVSDVENGKKNVSVETFVRFCEALETAPWDVLKEALTNTKNK